MTRLAARVRMVMAQRTLLSLASPFQRLCVLLLQLPQAVVGGVIEVDQSPTHQELAIMINASRETVTRSFQLLFLNKVLVREGNALRLIQPTVLQDIANCKRTGKPYEGLTFKILYGKKSERTRNNRISACKHINSQHR